MKLKLNEDMVFYRAYSVFYNEYPIQSGVTSAAVQLNNQAGLMKKMIFTLRPTANLQSGGTYMNNLSFLDGTLLSGTGNFQFNINSTPFVLPQLGSFNKFFSNTMYPRRVYGSNIYYINATLEDSKEPQDEVGFADVSNGNVQLLFNFSAATTQAYTLSVVQFYFAAARYETGILRIYN